MNLTHLFEIGIVICLISALSANARCHDSDAPETCAQTKSVEAHALLQRSRRVEHAVFEKTASREAKTTYEGERMQKFGQTNRHNHSSIMSVQVYSFKQNSTGSGQVLSFSKYLEQHRAWHTFLGSRLLVGLLVCIIFATLMRSQSSMVRAIALCVAYNLTSASMIETNKWLMHPDRFPYPLMLTSNHMLTSWLLTICIRLVYPSAFPALQKIEVTWRFGSNFLPIGAMFAVSVVCANAAYQYLSVPFLQVMKQCNVVVIYTLAVLCGIDSLKRCSIITLTMTLVGTLMTVHGELNFQLIGFLLQVVSSFSEAGKVVTQGILMGGSTKLDPLTLVLFMAPACLLAIVLPFCAIEAHKAPEIRERFALHYVMIITNALLAFTLNVVVAHCIKLLSPVGYIMMGTLKDVFIVSSSAIFLGEHLTLQQILGFVLAVTGVASYSMYKQNIDCFVEDELIIGIMRVSKRIQGSAPEDPTKWNPDVPNEDSKQEVSTSSSGDSALAKAKAAPLPAPAEAHGADSTKDVSNEDSKHEVSTDSTEEGTASSEDSKAEISS